MLVDRSIRHTLQVLRSLAKDVLHTFVISVPLVIGSVMQKTISVAQTPADQTWLQVHCILQCFDTVGWVEGRASAS